MTDRAFAAALASTLIPGGRLAHGVEAPAAGALLDEQTLGAWLALPAAAAILNEIKAQQQFAESDAEEREAVLREIETAEPAAFAALVATLLRLYYEHPAVLEAFGWSSAPPQPDGHRLADFDTARFDAVAKRGSIWRPV